MKEKNMKLTQWDLIKLGIDENTKVIVIPEKIKVKGKDETITQLEAELFFGFKAEKIILPDTIQNLPEGLCVGCNNLKVFKSNAKIEKNIFNYNL